MKKVFLVPYFGSFPNYFQLWLDSCGRNKDFNWIILTDCDLKNLKFYNNTTFINTTINDIERIIKDTIYEESILTTPYKLCDYRPVFWSILDYYQIKYDYWGYCDIDLIFGNLSKFLPDSKLKKYDKIMSNGHLTLFNSKKEIKEAYKLSGSKYNFKEIFRNVENIGFDEHHGINKIFESNNFNTYKNISIVADIDPQFKSFYLFYQPYNKTEQFFALKEGKVFQYYKKNNFIKIREFAYIHIQKRKMNLDEDIIGENTYLINQDGFSKLNKDISSNFITKNEGIKTKINKIRTKLRFYKHRLLNVI
jgi:hypothetical protein